MHLPNLGYFKGRILLASCYFVYSMLDKDFHLFIHSASLVNVFEYGCISSFVYSSIWNNTNCVCVKRITLWNCLCSSSSSPSSRFSASFIRNIGEFGAKNYFAGHRTANTIQLFVPIKRNFFESILFQNKLQQKGIP